MSRPELMHEGQRPKGESKWRLDVIGCLQETSKINMQKHPNVCIINAIYGNIWCTSQPIASFHYYNTCVVGCLSGWCRLTLPFHLCHASHAFVFIFVLLMYY